MAGHASLMALGRSKCDLHRRQEFVGVLAEERPQPTAQVPHDELLRVLAFTDCRDIVHLPDQLTDAHLP